MELQSLVPPEHRKDTAILAVSPDTPDDMRKLIPRVTHFTGGDFPVTLLSDADHRVIDAYGLRNEEAAADGEFMPHPTTYVIDRTGKVRWKFTSKNFAVRPSNQTILAELNKIW